MPPRAEPRSRKMGPPLDKRRLQDGFGAVTNNLVWVVDPETHPGAARPREVFLRLHLRATPPTEGIFKGAS
jgi:hypothetical protein